MASSQKRLLTAPTSKLGKVDLTSVLRRDDAWILLPQEVREELYSLLPEPQEGEPSHDPDIHPLNTVYKSEIEEEVRRFKEDLTEGREQKKWRDEAMQASKDRLDGNFDDWKEMQREEYWGKREAENVTAEVNGSKKGKGEPGNGDLHADSSEIKDGEGDQ